MRSTAPPPPARCSAPCAPPGPGSVSAAARRSCDLPRGRRREESAGRIGGPMGKGDREREQLRQERIEAEEKESRGGSNRLILSYAIVSTVVIVIAVLVFVLLSGGGSDSESGN